MSDITETEKRKEIIDNFAITEKDTGSSDVQIALLTNRIGSLTEHLKKFPKDIHSRRGLTMMVNRRKKLLSYLDRTQHSRYLKILKELNLRH